MLRPIFVSLLLAAGLEACPLAAQTSLPQPSATPVSLPRPTPAPSAAVSAAIIGQGSLPRAFWVAPVLGGVCGALVGAGTISYDKINPGTRTGHRIRAGLTYGIVGGATASALMLKLSGPDPPQPHSFWFDRRYTPFLVGMAAVQTLDYTSTRHFRKLDRNEWLLTNGAVDDRATFMATEASVVAGAFSVAYILHRTGHHRAERWFERTYVAVGISSATRNYLLQRLPPPSSTVAGP